MSTYEKTWYNDSPNYNTWTARALNKVETQAAKMWSINSNSTWGEVSASRAIGTTYTNGDYPRLVVACIKMDSDSVNGAPRNRFTLDPAGTPYVVGEVTPSDTAATLSISKTLPIMGIVNPGEQYQISEVTAGGGNAVQTWYEFDLDATWTAQTYTDFDTPTTTELNNYAGAVNEVGDRTFDSTDSTYSSFTKGATQSPVTFVAASVSPSNGLDAGEVKWDQKDSGGTYTKIGELASTVLGENQISFPMIVNDGGAVDWSTVSGNPLSGTSGKLSLHQASAITFTGGESGSATEQKFRDLDTNASNGLNTTVGFTRTDAGTTMSARTPSNSAWSFVAVWLRLETGTDGATSAYLKVDGTNRTVCDLGQNDSDKESEVMMMAVVPAGSTWSIGNTGTTPTIQQRTEWVAQG